MLKFFQREWFEPLTTRLQSKYKFYVPLPPMANRKQLEKGQTQCYLYLNEK